MEDDELDEEDGGDTDEDMESLEKPQDVMTLEQAQIVIRKETLARKIQNPPTSIHKKGRLELETGNWGSFFFLNLHFLF